LKIDVQGAEILVLEGGKRVLDATEHVVIEVTFYAHYEEDALFPEIHEWMTEAGFVLWAMNPLQRNHGRAMWADALYTRGSVPT
jgi:hypothetical protein